MKNQLKLRRWAALAGAPVMMAVALMPASVAARGARALPAAAASAHAAVPAWGAMQDARPDGKAEDPGAGLGLTTYQNQCSICHQADRKGVPPTFPSLAGVTSRLTDAQITDIVHNGRGRMPAQPTLEPASVTAVIAYLKASDAATPTESGPPPPPSSPASNNSPDQPKP